MEDESKKKETRRQDNKFWQSRVASDGAIQSARTVSKKDHFKLCCGLPQCPRDLLSGQMSEVTENKFIFPQWKGKKKKEQLCHSETNTCTSQSLAS